jgi:hypothetical protein
VLAVLVLPTLEAMLGADVADDGPTTICGTVVTGTIAVDGIIAVDGTNAVDETITVGVLAPGSVAVFGVLWDAPALVLIVTDGTPATVEHVVSNARNENI